jgi:nucleotide-binding universal stress UspA family protein
MEVDGHFPELTSLLAPTWGGSLVCQAPSRVATRGGCRKVTHYRYLVIGGGMTAEPGATEDESRPQRIRSSSGRRKEKPMHILVATDGSDRTEAAARSLHALIPPSSVERITVFTVRQPVQVLGMLGWDGFVPAEAWDEMEEEANRTAREALERAVVDLSGLAGRIETLARSGLPGEEIVRASCEIGADLGGPRRCSRGPRRGSVASSCSPPSRAL